MTRILGFMSGAVMGALPITMLLFFRPVVPNRAAMLVAFVAAVVVSVPAHRAASWWLTGAFVGFVTAPAIIGFEWLAAVYVLLIPAVMLPMLAGAAAGIVAGHTLDAWGNQKSEI